MDNKENIAFSLGIQKNMDKTLTNSNKINIRASNINGLVNDLDMEKQYLAKLKIQRQKTQKLHSQYVKLKKQKDKFKEDYQVDILNTKIKLSDCQSQLNKKIDQLKQFQRQIQKLKLQIEKINRQRNENMANLKFSYQQNFLELKNNMETLNQNLQAKSKQINSLKKNHSVKISELQNQKLELQSSCKNNQLKMKQAQQKKKQAQRLASQLNKRIQDLIGESNRMKIQIESKNKEINSCKSVIQRTQIQNQSIFRKVNEMQTNINDFSEKLLEKDRQNQKLKSKLEDSQEKLRKQKNQKQKFKQQLQNLKNLADTLKCEINKKQQTIRQYSTRILKKQDQDLWRQRLTEKQHENEELLDIIRSLKQENDSLMSFIKQKQMLQRERRSLVQYQMEEISKFESLLKDVK